MSESLEDSMIFYYKCSGQDGACDNVLCGSDIICSKCGEDNDVVVLKPFEETVETDKTLLHDQQESNIDVESSTEPHAVAQQGTVTPEPEETTVDELSTVAIEQSDDESAGAAEPGANTDVPQPDTHTGKTESPQTDHADGSWQKVQPDMNGTSSPLHTETEGPASVPASDPNDVPTKPLSDKGGLPEMTQSNSSNGIEPVDTGQTKSEPHDPGPDLSKRMSAAYVTLTQPAKDGSMSEVPLKQQTDGASSSNIQRSPYEPKPGEATIDISIPLSQPRPTPYGPDIQPTHPVSISQHQRTSHTEPLAVAANECYVTFHAVLPTKKSKIKVVQLIVGEYVMDNLKFERKVYDSASEKYFLVYSLKVAFYRDRINMMNCHEIRYRYSIYSSSKRHFTDEVNPGGSSDRCMSVKGKFSKADHIDRYDGMIFKKIKSSIFGTSSSGIKDVQEMISKGIEYMLPAWTRVECEPMEVFVGVVRAISKDVENRDGRNYSDILCENLIEHIKMGIREIREGEFNVQLPAALGIIQMIFEFKLEEKSKQKMITAPLCSMLLLGSDETTVMMQLNSLEVHFPSYSKTKLTILLTRFVNEICTLDFCEPHWVLVLPLLHFITRQSSLGEPLAEGIDHRKEVWWGTQSVQPAIRYFKNSQYPTLSNISEYMKQLEPLMKIDQLLPRSLIAAIGMVKLPASYWDLFPIEVILAAEIRHINSRQRGRKSHMPELESYLREKLRLAYVAELTPFRVDEVVVYLNDTLDLLLEYLIDVRSIIQEDLLITAGELYIYCLRCIKLRSAPDVADVNRKIESYLMTLVNYLKSWLRDGWQKPRRWPRHFTFGKPDEWKMYSKWLKYSFGNDESDNYWKQKVVAMLKDQYRECRPDKILDLYCAHDFSHHPDIEQMFCDMALNVVTVNTKYNAILCLEDNSQDTKRKMLVVMSRMLIKDWPEAPDQLKVLTFMLTWQPMKNYLSLLKWLIPDYREMGCAVECHEHINRVVQELLAVRQSLNTCTISIRLLKLILKHKDTYCHITQYFIHDDTSLDDILLTNEHALQVFTEFRENVAHTTQLCRDMVGVFTLEEKLCVDDDLLVMAVVVPADFFEISDNLAEMIMECAAFKESSIFSRMWDELVSRQRDVLEEISLDEMVLFVWPQLRDRMESIGRDLADGSILLSTIRRVFGVFSDDQSQLTRELDVIRKHDKSSTTNWVPLRCGQIMHFFTYEQYLKGIDVLLKVKATLELTGDFSGLIGNADLESVNSNEDISELMTQKPLSWMNEVHFEQARVDLSPKEVECLETLHQAGDLVKWLKNSLKGPDQVKVLVDLALITASGQGGVEISKVRAMQDAVLGYAPLIYDVKSTDGFTKLYTKSKEVFDSLETDVKLPDKLSDLSKNLDWLKRVETTKGTMEINAFEQVKLINRKGFYRVGCLNKDQKHMAKALENIIELEIDKCNEPESTTSMKIHYTYKELKDLQSKLMLVAGKAEEGKEEIDRFVDVLDGITQMAAVYLEMRKSGSILFQEWSCMFFCDRDRPVDTTIDFGLSAERMIGRKTADDNSLSEHIFDICNFLRECLDEWKQYMHQKRKQFYCLDYFTTKQIVILQQELAELVHRDTLSRDSRGFSLLHFVLPGCSEEHLKQASEHALIEVESADTNTGDLTSLSNDIKLREEFISDLIMGGILPSMARRALDHFGCDADMDEVVMWCEDGNNLQAVPDGHSLQTLTTDLVQRQTAQDELPEKRWLSIKLGDLWRSFLAKVSTTLTDFISIDHLGYILENLSRLKTKDQCERLKRTFPSLKKDVPNLITCPKAKMLETILSLYMQDSRQVDLPNSNEVLLCSPNTTAEEIDLMVRRAVGDTYGRTFCLAGVDELDYEVARGVETVLETQCKGLSDLQLVVICSQEREDHSYVATSMEQYRSNYVPVHNLESVKNFIKTNLQVTETTVVNPACSLDPESCGVRYVKSERAGMGKSLYVKRLASRHEKQNNKVTCAKIPIYSRNIDVDLVTSLLRDNTNRDTSMIYHIDIFSEVMEGVDSCLFNLLILGCLTDSEGDVWQRKPTDMYMMESTEYNIEKMDTDGTRRVVVSLLPYVTCWSPTQCLEILEEGQQGGVSLCHNDYDQLMDDNLFKSESYQRTYQYLTRYQREDSARNPFRDVNVSRIEGNHIDCLRTLTRHCGMKEPSWVELQHFVDFLNAQLKDCEMSDFCAIEDNFFRFEKFIVEFMINMSRDFATRSLAISEESHDNQQQAAEEEIDGTFVDLGIFQLKRRWENTPHPYIFFNEDTRTAERHDMTFIGFNVNTDGLILDALSGQQIGRINTLLRRQLIGNGIKFNEDFDSLKRMDKIARLCAVMGVEEVWDPDETYELTTDNVKKILAIHMRFRCGIPVVIMGETGCGKTRLVKFMCDLQKPRPKEKEKKKSEKGSGDSNDTAATVSTGETHQPSNDPKEPTRTESDPEEVVENMIIVKVHGGTTENDIMNKTNAALEWAAKNKLKHAHMDTVLFYDEANTTPAIGLIKEILCDGSMRGQLLPAGHSLKFVVCCNPYRRHSDQVIQQLEQAGLGYHVSSAQTKETLGSIPMRHLVYRVHALPQSMLPLVWDFGQLSTPVETLYIKQIANRYIREGKIPDQGGIRQVISQILAASHEFIKERQKEECCTVSLRDVDRAFLMMSWFYKHRQTIFPYMDRWEADQQYNLCLERDSSNDRIPLSPVTRALVLALGICYQGSLQRPDQYRLHVAEHFSSPVDLPGGATRFAEEIDCCQEVFLDRIKLTQNIARNRALKENVFTMTVCIQLRIPLFLVGKPGSSKSLSKTIVADAMQGKKSHSPLYKEFKLAQMTSFQCSPHASAEGIIDIFQKSAQLQKDNDLDTFVSVVVLDEVGLAEDSPRMPLKVLHPLLEDGCQGDDKPELYKKVAFVAISNWALDPAKMNRGINLQRTVPDKNELVKSAEGICSVRETMPTHIRTLIPPLAKGYQHLMTHAQEFFGLRDFYSLAKMVHSLSQETNQELTWHQLKYAILRNFGGKDNISPVDSFKLFINTINTDEEETALDPSCHPCSLIKDCLSGLNPTESRYLLLLTRNYAALTFLQQNLMKDTEATVIFGSSFPRDMEYTQVCRNINRIKVCMETGRAVILLNLENIYESLYDALNQYYSEIFGSRFVDIGLGTQRLKCEVHPNFRLVVVAEKEVVYQRFPIPLVNRLEKHILTMETMLNEQQVLVKYDLHQWVKRFCDMARREPRFNSCLPDSICDLDQNFVGYHEDTAATVIMHVTNTMMQRDHGDELWAEQVSDHCKLLLLQCATPDSVIRLASSTLNVQERQAYFDEYFTHQKHENISELIVQQLTQTSCDGQSGIFIQVSTHSRLLSSTEARDIGLTLGLPDGNMQLTLLQAFNTEHQFHKMLRDIQRDGDDSRDKLLILQCSTASQYGDLLACAKYNIQEVFGRDGAQVHVVLIVQLQRSSNIGYIGFQGGRWKSFHIDDLHRVDTCPPINVLKDKSICLLYEDALKKRGRFVPVRDSLADPEGTDYVIPHEAALNNIDEVYDDTDHTVTSKEATKGKDEFEMIGEENQLTAEPTGERDGGQSMAANPTSLTKVEPDAECVTRRQHMMVLDINHLRDRCLHASVVQINDLNEESSRKIKRLEILFSLLQQPHQSTGGEVLSDLVNENIYKLLHRHEKYHMTSETSKYWLHREAAANENVTKAGTFRRSIWKTLESKVSFVLAKLIVYIDTNNNLDTLFSQNDENPEWLKSLWLALFKEERVDISDSDSTMHGRGPAEVTARTTGCYGKPFTAELPFSWNLFTQLDNLCTDIESRQVHENLLSALHRCLDGSKTVSTLRTFAHQDHNIFDRYLHDFVRMVYVVQSDKPEKEYMAIAKTLVHAFGKYKEDHCCIEPACEGDKLRLDLAALHLTHRRFKRRIDLCAEALQLSPNCLEKAFDASKQPEFVVCKDNIFECATEMTLDMQILCLLLDELDPRHKKSTFDKPEGYRETRTTWVNLVERYKPVINHILDNVVSSGELFGDVCRSAYKSCSDIWSKINLVYTFIRHVCPINEEVKSITMVRCLQLFVRLPNVGGVDLKKENTMNVLENFLKTCIKRASEVYFNTATCPVCNQPMIKPVDLPCGHVTCMACVDFYKRKECPKCKVKFPEDYEVLLLKEKSEAIDAHNKFKGRLDSFFMNVVSTMCFHGDEPPEDEVVRKLMSFVTRANPRDAVREQPHLATQQMSIFRDTMDPSPVVRSFLLQLLLQSNIDRVENHLETYLSSAIDTMEETSNDVLEMCMLCVFCLEDYFTNQSNKERDTAGKVDYMMRMVQLEVQGLSLPGMSFRKLRAVAAMRFVIAEAAKAMHAVFIDCTADLSVYEEFFELIEEMCIRHDQTAVTNAHIYLIKNVCKINDAGLQAMQLLSKCDSLKWVNPEKTEEDTGGPDPYVLLGDDYVALRDAIAAVLVEEMSPDNLISIIESQSVQTRGGYLLMAVYREVTTNLAHIHSTTNQVSEQLITRLPKYLNKHQHGVFIQLINNQLGQGCPQMTLTSEQTMHHHNIVGLLLHFLITIPTNGDNRLLDLFTQIIHAPDKVQNSYFPTMPGDMAFELFHIIKMRVEGETQYYSDALVPQIWRCPNGHPYVIGDCGNPTDEALCNECNAPIGGQAYHVAHGANSRVGSAVDHTLPGHVLGAAVDRSRDPAPEREMSVLVTCAIRSLVHIAMILGANMDMANAAKLIRPPVSEEEVPSFLWQHLQLDLLVLARAMNKNVDEAGIFLHLLIDDIHKITRTPASGFDALLPSKNCRKIWEDCFMRTYMSDFDKDLDDGLASVAQMLIRDKRAGNNLLLRILYGTEVVEDFEPDRLTDHPAMWSPRSAITVDHMKRTFWMLDQNEQNKCQTLKLFIAEEKLLRLLRCLPEILKLQSFLYQKFNAEIEKKTAEETTIGELKQKYPECVQLVDSFIAVWNLLRNGLSGFAVRMDTTGKTKTVPREICNVEMTDHSCLTVLLPTVKGPGLCSSGLVHYLVDIQNSFLEDYTILNHLSTFTSHVSTHSVTMSHLIAFHPARDLLPLVFANCNYSLTIGESIDIKYDICNLEKQIEEKFIAGRQLLRAQVKCIRFKEYLTSREQFDQISQKIPQTPLHVRVQAQIRDKLRHLPDLNDSLEALDTTIGFLKSVGGQPELSLIDFINNTLHMQAPALQEVAQHCHLGHIKSLWMVMSLERAKHLSECGQDSFEATQDKYREPIPDELRDQLRGCLSRLHIDNFLMYLYELIILLLDEELNPNDEDYQDKQNFPLGYTIADYIKHDNQAGYVEIAALEDGSFPCEILAKHSVATWRLALQVAKDDSGTLIN